LGFHSSDFDSQVERSKTRPLAAGDITPLQGWLFWALNIALLIPLVLKLNKLWYDKEGLLIVT
jgi:4-hydroxybenzoate polyprenyltransferase